MGAPHEYWRCFTAPRNFDCPAHIYGITGGAAGPKHRIRVGIGGVTNNTTCVKDKGGQMWEPGETVQIVIAQLGKALGDLV